MSWLYSRALQLFDQGKEIHDYRWMITQKHPAFE